MKTLLTIALLGTLAAVPMAAQQAHPRAKISLEAARRTALARVPGATVASEELEQEHGHLLYSFDLKVAGRPGIEEVQVDANTGTLLGVEHEGPTQEAAEARQEARESAATERHEQVPPLKEEKPGLAARAKITAAAAQRTALVRVPFGRVVSQEIEEEDGHLVYSFDIRVNGRSGIEEVLIDALTGKVLKQEHEGSADEARERQEEAEDHR